MSALELAELRHILDDASAKAGNDEEVRDDIAQALQALQMHQCVYSDYPLSGRVYDTVLRHRSFFEKYFSASRQEVVIDNRDGMAALSPTAPSYGWRENRLKKDETLTLLALRYHYEEGMRAGAMNEQGRVDISTDELYDTFREIAKSEPPAESRMIDILRDLRRRGVVRVGERDRTEKVTPLVILPGIRVVVPDIFVEGVISWLEQGAKDETADFMGHLNQRLSGQAAASAPNNENDPQDADDATTEIALSDHAAED